MFQVSLCICGEDVALRQCLRPLSSAHLLHYRDCQSVAVGSCPDVAKFGHDAFSVRRVRAGTQDLLEGSGLLPGQNRGWQPDTPPLKSAPAAAPIQEHESEGPELHPAMSEGARNLLEGSGLLPERKDRA